MCGQQAACGTWAGNPNEPQNNIRASVSDGRVVGWTDGRKDRRAGGRTERTDGRWARVVCDAIAFCGEPAPPAPVAPVTSKASPSGWAGGVRWVGGRVGGCLSVCLFVCQCVCLTVYISVRLKQGKHAERGLRGATRNSSSH